MHPDIARRFLTAALVATVFLAVPSHASGRRRSVTPPTAGNKLTADQISGTVLDDVTSQPVVGMRVHVGDRSDATDSAGKFLVKNITGYHGLIIVEATRSGYTTKTLNLTTGGNQVLTIRVQPLPTVHVRKTDNTTFETDFDSIMFGYPVVFIGYNSAPFEEFCKPNGTAVTIDRSEIRRIFGPATLVTQASCCTERQVLRINAELKSGETTDLYFVDTCNGIASIDFIGRNHINGKVEYTPFTAIAEIVFP